MGKQIYFYTEGQIKELESAFLAEQEALAEAGQLITATTVFQDYQERIGRTFHHPRILSTSQAPQLV